MNTLLTRKEKAKHFCSFKINPPKASTEKKCSLHKSDCTQSQGVLRACVGVFIQKETINANTSWDKCPVRIQREMKLLVDADESFATVHVGNSPHGVTV